MTRLVAARVEQPPAVICDDHVAANTIQETFHEIQGTEVAVDVPLMAAGLDSVAATEFGSTLTDRLNTTLPQTVLFDHPTIAAVASFVVATAILPESWQLIIA